MRKIFKIILIIPIAIFGAEFLAAPTAFASDNLVVQFEQTPLFSEANFLPGEGITRWVKVTNNSGQTQRIATQPLNITDPNHLGAVLNLVIKEGGTTLYNNALSNFLANGEVYLYSLANGATTQYDFTVSFYSGAQNTFQGKSLGFDILIGFQGTEGGILPGAGSSSGGGGGGWLPPGLTIQNQAVVTTTDVSVTITWNTSYPATSQVIYALEGEKHILDLTDNAGTPPKYGYSRTTPESDIASKVTYHSVVITGLTPNTKYYYRSVSHGSLAVSQEYTFTTLGVKTEEEKIAEETVSTNETPPKIISAPSEGQTSAEQPAVSPSTPSDESTPNEAPFVSGAEPQIENNQVVGQQTEQPPKQSSFLAAVSSIFTLGTGNIWVSLLILLIIGGIVYYFIQRERRKNLK